jgi:hypothetical protein
MTLFVGLAKAYMYAYSFTRTCTDNAYIAIFWAYMGCICVMAVCQRYGVRVYIANSPYTPYLAYRSVHDQPKAYMTPHKRTFAKY